MQINGKNVCDFCFEPLSANGICKKCGLSHDTYKTDSQALRPGTTLNGNYVIGAVLTTTGNCYNYLAYSHSYDKKVVLKEYFPASIVSRNNGDAGITPKSPSDKEKLESGITAFAEEAKKIASFNASKNIRIVYELFYENNTVYYSTEDLSGESLGAFVRSNGGKLSEYEALTVAKHICNALMVIHNAGMIHREICPESIFITDSGTVKLTEFSMAASLAQANSSPMDVTHSGYAPVEFYTAKRECGYYSDVYSVGALLYYCAFGKTVADAMSRTEGAEIKADESANKVSDEFMRIVNKCLKINSAERYQTIFDLANDITLRISELIAKGAVPTAGANGEKKIVLEVAVASTGMGSVAGAAAVAGKAVSGSAGPGIFEPSGLSSAGASIHEPSGISVLTSSNNSASVNGADGLKQAVSDAAKETAPSKAPTSDYYSGKSTARDKSSSQKSESKATPENKSSANRYSDNRNVQSVSNDEVINVGDMNSAAEAEIINVGDMAPNSAPAINVGDAVRVAAPAAAAPKSFPVALLVALISAVVVAGAGAIMYFTGVFDGIFDNNNYTGGSGSNVCSYCRSVYHSTLQHPECEFCGEKTHFTEDHPRCEYCGMQEHATEEHPPCAHCGTNEHFTKDHPACRYCGSNKHFTEGHPPCRHCGSYEHFTDGHVACGICGQNDHATNKHPCDYCDVEGHASENCPNKPQSCTVCGEYGHTSEYCPYISDGYGYNLYCSNCGFCDHDTNNCPYNSPYYPIPCPICGEYNCEYYPPSFIDRPAFF